MPRIYVLPLRVSLQMISTSGTEVRILSSVSYEYDDIRCGGNLFTTNKTLIVLKFPLVHTQAEHTPKPNLSLEHPIKE